MKNMKGEKLPPQTSVILSLSKDQLPNDSHCDVARYALNLLEADPATQMRATSPG